MPKGHKCRGIAAREPTVKKTREKILSSPVVAKAARAHSCLPSAGHRDGWAGRNAGVVHDSLRHRIAQALRVDRLERSREGAIGQAPPRSMRMLFVAHDL